MKSMLVIGYALAIGLLSPALGRGAELVSTAPQNAPVDYSNPGAWICRPGRQDVCKRDLDATVISANGSVTIKPFRPAADAPADCFYVYGTISRDQQPLSDMTPGPDEEVLFVRTEAGRLGQACRVFAPVYRQSTLAAMAGKAPHGDHAITYGDIRDAFAYYLTHDNHGRGFVVIGHSQGGSLVRELVQREIEGEPVQRRLLSAVIIGADLTVPGGADVGGAFKTVPLCRSGSQIGCAISYHAYRSTIPDSFGGMSKTPTAGMTVACVNPAALAKGTEALDAYLPRLFDVPTAPPQPAWSQHEPISTRFVSLPGMLSARCVAKGPLAYLEVTVHAKPTDGRTQDIPGDAYSDGAVQASWGLHFIETGLLMGDLVDLIRQESRAFARQSHPSPN